MVLGTLLVAFVTATVFTLLELVTSRYPRTFFLIAKSSSLYAYALIYGFISGVVMLGLDYLVAQGTVKLEGLGLSSPYVRAVAVGLTAKALLHVRLFSVAVGSQTFPIGIETFVQPFEPWLLRLIELEHFDSASKLVAPRAAKYADLNDVEARIRAELPLRLPPAERSAFLADLDRASTVSEAMQLYLEFVGRRIFNRVFPP